jgi:hypothetical protein
MHRSGEQEWVSVKESDRPTASPIQVGQVSSSGSSATVYVSFRTHGSDTGPGNTGCNSWRGTYSLVASQGGGWLIDASNLARTSVSC